MKKLFEYTNGNYQVTILEDGTKIRQTEMDEFIPEFPESLDIKLTNWCDGTPTAPLCSFCHENSSPKGKHANLGELLHHLRTLPMGVELACLEENTNVYTPTGMVKIKDIKVGDFVYDENLKPVMVNNVIASEKECVELEFNKGNDLKIVCSKDHRFIDTNFNEVEAVELNGKFLKIAKQTNSVDKIIDLSEFITVSKNKRFGRSGAFTDTHVKLSHVTPEIGRFPVIDKDLMYLYGISVAEGSRRGISLNIKETDIANKTIQIYKKKFGVDSKIYTHNNSMQIEFDNPTIYNVVFFKAMQIGYHAKNKSIKFLFNLDTELVREALYAMFLGDGCLRTRNRENGKLHYSLSYKTVSYNLVKELQFLLYTHFGVHSSYYSGISKDRYIEGRLLKESSYYSLDIYGKNNITKLFPFLYENDEEFNTHAEHAVYTTTDLKCTSIKEVGVKKVYDITLEENSSHLFVLDNGIVTHNCGGGNPLSHPGLISFLTELKQRGFIANITINQMHIKPYYDTIVQLINEDLVKGVGISIANDDFTEIIELKKLTNNIVFHVILGIHSPETVDKLMELGGAKILLLGYKRFGRGINFYSRSIKNGINEWYKNIHKYIGKCVLSFDNLAIEQLELKRVFTDEGWSRFYMGDDFCYTMYIDAVKEEYAPTSRSSEGRVGFGEMSLLDYFTKYRGTYEKID